MLDYKYQFLPHCGRELISLSDKKHIYEIKGEKKMFVKVLTLDEKNRKDMYLEVELQSKAFNMGFKCPRIYDHYMYNGDMFIIMEKLKAKTIKDRFGKNEEQVPKRIFKKIREIVDTLYYKGIEYIDITSVNFMIDGNDNVYVIDFGHAYYRKGNTIDYYLDEFLDGEDKWNQEMI